jgi:hypothetical protein
MSSHASRSGRSVLYPPEYGRPDIPPADSWLEEALRFRVAVELLGLSRQALSRKCAQALPTARPLEVRFLMRSGYDQKGALLGLVLFRVRVDYGSILREEGVISSPSIEFAEGRRQDIMATLRGTPGLLDEVFRSLKASGDEWAIHFLIRSRVNDDPWAKANTLRAVQLARDLSYEPLPARRRSARRH